MEGSRSSIGNGRTDFVSIPGFCGIINGGNTCYINSLIQCLSHTPNFTQILVSYVNPESESNGTLVLELSKILSQLQYPSSQRRINIIAFNQWIWGVKSLTQDNDIIARFPKGRQQDVHEFLIFLSGFLTCS